MITRKFLSMTAFVLILSSFTMIDNRVYAAGNKSNNSSKAATGNNSRKRGKNKRIGEGAESSAEGLRAEIKTPTKGETIITSPKAGDKSHIGTLLREILDDESRKNQGEQQDTSEIEEDKRKEDNPFADGLGEYYDELVKKDSRNGIEVADENNSVKGDSDLIGTKEEQLVSDKKVSKVIENLSNDTEFVRTMGETFGMDISKLRDAAVALDDNSVDKVENNLSSSLMVEKRSSEESNNPLSKSLDSSLAPVRNNLTKEEEEALNDKNKPLMAGLDNSGNNKEKLSGIEEEERQRLVDKEREAREIEDRKRNEHFGKLLRDSIAKEAANKKKAEEAEKQRQKKEKEELDRGFAEYYAGRDEALKRDQIEKERQDERLVIENPDLIIVKSSEEEEKLGPVDKKINKEDNLNDSKDEKEIIEGNRSQYLPFYDTIFEKGVPSEPNNDPTKKIVSSRGLATITDDEITDGDDEGSKTSDNDNEEGSKEKEKGSKKRRGKESKKIEKEEESPEPEVRGEEGEKEEEREEGEKVEESDSQTTDEATREHRGYFISDVLDAFMLANSARPINIYSRIGNANKAGAIGFFTDLAYTNAKVDKTTNNVGGVQLGLIFPTEETKVVLGVGANFNRHSIAGEKENKANINSFGFGIYGGFNGDIFDFRTGLAINKNNFSIDRKITTLSEEYNGNYNSKFVGNTFSFDMEAGVKFKVANYLRLRPYVGLQTAILSIRDFSESGPSKDVRLKVNSRNYHLTMGRLGIDLVSAYDTSSPIDFHLGIGGKFKIPSKPMALSATLENETIKNEGTKDLKYLFGVDAGVGYRIGKNMTLGGNVGYYGSKSTVRSVDAKVLFKIDL